MNDLIDIIIDLLPEFDLPEPESPYSIEHGEGHISLIVAFPQQKIGIRQGASPSVKEYGEWRVWECENEEKARVVCHEIAQVMGIEPSVLRLDFSRIETLIQTEQVDAARQALEELQGQIQRDHPDWTFCEKYRKEIRRHAKKRETEKKPPVEPAKIQVSFPGLLRQDAARVKPPETPDFNFMGFFSPEDESLSAVDAVWIAQFRQGAVEVWAACLEGNPAYAADPSWETVGTEVDLLQGLLDRMQDDTTFVWGLHDILRLIQNWHYRTKGVVFPDRYNLLDLQSLCEVAFPLSYRTDLPEFLCKQMSFEFRDEMGIGESLAAMTTLLSKCTEVLRALPDGQRAVLRMLLGYRSSGEVREVGLFDMGTDRFKGPVVPQFWLDVFLPAPSVEGFTEYLQLLKERFEKLSAPVQKTMGNREGSGFHGMDFFKKGGFLPRAASFEYHERADQIGFSQRIEESLSGKRPYVLEAGTGIGKTIGYLVPALLAGKRTFISTHTKALQDQAWSKDVPLVLEAFSLAGIERSVTIIKGKVNYVCLQTVADWIESPAEILYTPENVFFLASLLNWLLLTETGWLSEIEHLGNWRLIQLLGRDQAPPKLQDIWAGIDPHARTREAATKADLVLTNHSYVFALANASDTSKQDIDVLILDEAHNVDDVVTEVLTLHFRPWGLMHEIDSVLKRDKEGKVRGLYRALLMYPQIGEQKELKLFASRLELFEKQLHSWVDDARKRLNEMMVNVQDFDPDLPISFHLKEFWIKSLYESAKRLYNNMNGLASAIHNLLEKIYELRGLPRRIPGSLGSLEEHLNGNATALKDLFDQRDDFVHWGEASVRIDERGRIVEEAGQIAWTAELNSTPLDIAGWLRDTVNPLYKYRIYVSAIMSIGGDFGPIIERLGLDAEREEDRPITSIFPSPFNYRKQALLAVPHDMPIADPKLRVDPLYIEAQSKHIADLASISDGRMLVLFTSRLIMREMAPRLQSRLRSLGITVLSQTDAGRSALIDRLREAPRKGEKIVLLGLRAFWEGVDVPGEALSILTVSRLPFEYYKHPVAQAKQFYYESKGFDRDYFRERVVPNVFLHLRQMYGRLIRSETDRGATVITDPRVYLRRYGKLLLQHLPETTTVVDKAPVVVDAVKRFVSGEEVASSYIWGELPIVVLGLSPEQQAIVKCPSKRILVRAAAGSGKTRVLISRMIRFIENGQAKPEEVLALTFTNKAMNVMLDRLESTLGAEKAFRMHRNVLTYHKLAMRIIRQDDREQGSELAFLDEKNPELQEELFRKARSEANLSIEALNDEDARTMTSYAQNGLINEMELEGKIQEWQIHQPVLAKFAIFFLAYVRLLREQNLIDYGEAIVRAVRILRENSIQAQRWNNRFKWIFCDEYQDSSPAQATLLQLIGQQANLFVVGDNAQSIYSWQGSDPGNLGRFELDFPNTASFNLSKNYRCFPKLVRVSSRFLERTGQAHGIHVEYDQKRSTEDQNVYFLHNEDDREEAKAAAKLAKEGLALEIPGDPPPKATVGILARKWHLLESIEAELIREGIPYKFEGETARGIVARARVRDLVTRAADIFAQVESGMEFGDTIDGRIARRIKDGQINKASTLLEALRSEMPGEDLSGAEISDFKRLCAIIGDRPPSFLSHMFRSVDDESRVVLSTVHSQKGEEFETVIVIGLEEGNSPHEPPKSHQRLLEWRKAVQAISHATWREPLTDDDLQRLYDEEESRIFYVAMTRAKYNLIVSRAKDRYVFNRHKRYDKSSFLTISHDPKCIQETSTPYDIDLIVPSPQTEDDKVYRSDGRVYQTSSRTFVRSKSEMLLANEFTRRGMYFEYEEPTEEVSDALPDFTFPDYGGIILEHLGLLPDAEYVHRWENKAKEYEEKGIRYFRTNEEEIKNLSSTVDRLREQFSLWVEEKHGIERIQLIDQIEMVRRQSGLRVGRSIGDIKQGIFLVDDINNEGIVAISLRDYRHKPEGEETSISTSCENIKADYGEVTWEEKDISGVKIWIGRLKQSA